MKYLSFVVPSYNAEKFLDRSIPSLLKGGEDVEIIIVNDGSKDHTLEIARRYEKENPSIVKVIDKANGGHGSTINAALEVATGLYFKCVDADDWLDEDTLHSLLATIKEKIKVKEEPDLFLTDFVYENVEAGIQHVGSLGKYFKKPGKTITWEDLRTFKYTDYIMMHMLVYRLDVLKKSKLHLPEHTFYVDNVYVYEPLYYVNTLCYLPISLYRYSVGRSDQSVSIQNADKNYAHQFRVFEKTMLCYTKEDLDKLSKKHRKQMIHAFITIVCLTQHYATIGDYKKKYAEYKRLVKKFKEENPSFYRLIRYRTLLTCYFNLPFFLKKFVVKYFYKLVMKRTGWN